MHAAALAVRRLGPRRIIVAAPTAAIDSVTRLEEVADRVVTLETPEPYYGVGAWYAEFPQLTDAEVLAYLARAQRRAEAAAAKPQESSPS
jgi:putative phosphoribosyl transferase